MFDPMDFLPAVPGTAAMLGCLVYLWAARRRSPRAAGLGAAGLASALLVHTGWMVGNGWVLQWVAAAGGLPGLSMQATYTVVVALYNLLLSGCLVLVVVAVLADRRPPAGGGLSDGTA